MTSFTTRTIPTSKGRQNTLAARVFQASASSEGTSAAEEKPLGADLMVVFVHQYSKLGGCQELMKGMALALAAKGFWSVTFDMPGVGGSPGRATLRGVSEIQAVESVCSWVWEQYRRPILLVGSSAGAPIAGSAVQHEAVRGFVGIGYTFGLLCSVFFGSHFQKILKSTKPKLFVMGTEDGFTSESQLRARVRAAAGRINELHLVQGVGHFELEGPAYDAYLAGLISEFAAKVQAYDSADAPRAEAPAL